MIIGGIIIREILALIESGNVNQTAEIHGDFDTFQRFKISHRKNVLF